MMTMTMRRRRRRRRRSLEKKEKKNYLINRTIRIFVADRRARFA